jgi:hypothetical protein
MRRITLALTLPFALALACGTGVTQTPAKSDGKAKEEAKSTDDADAKAKARAEAKRPANPHADMKAPAPAPKEKGPPREITPSGETRDEKVAELALKVPKEWETQPVTSQMRLAQFVLPGPGGDAELVVFRFPGGAGGVQANIDRWKGQFKPPEGKSIDDVTKTTNFEAGKLKITLVDVSGHYAAPERPGSPTMVDEPDYRMLSAIVEGSGDAFFLKALGPSKTLSVWSKAYEEMLKAATAG